MFLPGFNVSSCSVPPYLYSCLFSKPFHLSINLSLNNKDKAFIANPSTGSKANSANTRSVNGGEAINGDQTALQKHVAFFDRNKDGLIYPWETFEGFRAIGCGIPLSVAAAIFINGVLSWQSRPGKFPSLLFPIEIRNIHRTKHGSDSGVYDTEGRFVPAKFEEIFHKHAPSSSNALTSKELSQMLKSNRIPKNYYGWLAAWGEWTILYYLCKDKDGFLHKETIRSAYDGSLFEKMEKERRSSHKAK
uniref:Peroxygenase 4 n=2 Tax=Nelumbo nucifera TaxID=4432 RepID=A0A822YJ97_NELNU|nr:TPA_asm: hypothetical protein HUJ06_011034 [Nelumbo nucifera]